MDLLATLRRSGGIDALARQIGLPPATVFAGAEALMPALLERILPVLAMLVCGYLSARAEADRSEGESSIWLRDLLMLQDPEERRSGSGTNG